MEKEIRNFEDVVGTVDSEGYVHLHNKQGLIEYLNEFVWYREGGTAVVSMFYAGFGGYKEVWEIKTNYYRILADNYSGVGPAIEWTAMVDIPEPVYESDGVKITGLF